MVAGLSAANTIPRTSIQDYYKRVCGMSYAQRLQLADELVRDPSPLVGEFQARVAKIASYDNQESFYSNSARAPKLPALRDKIVKTSDVACICVSSIFSRSSARRPWMRAMSPRVRTAPCTLWLPTTKRRAP